MTNPIPAGPGLLSPGLRALTIAGETMVWVEAFEMVAVSTAMPVSMTVLITGRAIQGLGTGLTTVAIYVVVARTFPEVLRSRVFSSYAAAWVLPALLGPAVCGFLVVHAVWRWVFLSVTFTALAAAVTGWAPCRRLGGRPIDNRRSANPGVDRRKMGFAAIAGAAACLLSVAGQRSPAVAVPLGAIAIALLMISVPRLLPRATYFSGRGLPTVILLRGLLSAAFAGAEISLPLLLSRERGLLTDSGRHRVDRSSVGLACRFGSAGQDQLGGATLRPARERVRPVDARDPAHLGDRLAQSPAADDLPLLGGRGRRHRHRLPPTLSVLTLELSTPADQGASTSALQANDALLQAITLAISGTVLASLIARSHTAPHLARFAISATAAATGALLATRVRLRADGCGPDSRLGGAPRQGETL